MKYQSEGITAYQGDCLVESDKIGDGVVDLILTDLPYGNMQGVDFDDLPHGKKQNKNQKIFWDKKLPTSEIFKIANRILRKNGKMVLFAQGYFVFDVYNSQIPNIPFSYKMVWDKQQFANCLLVNKAPLNYYEDILVFSKNHNKHDFKGLHPLRGYSSIVFEYIGKTKNEIYNIFDKDTDLPKYSAMHFFYSKNAAQFSLCTEKTYNQLIQVFHIDKMEGFRTFADLKAVNDKFRADLLHKMNTQYPSTFNLWEGKKYKSNILKYKKDYNGYHPTQKPVLLLEDLIKTFSNEGDLVVDLTAGSMSTGVACQNTGRKCTMIEMSDKYFNIGVKRLKENEHRIKTSLF